LEGLNYLLEKGFKILSVTIDGRKGIDSVFRNYPIQICQFHIQQRVRNLITDNPKSVAGKELKQINNFRTYALYNPDQYCSMTVYENNFTDILSVSHRYADKLHHDLPNPNIEINLY
jgi:hypothetical protein